MLSPLKKKNCQQHLIKVVWYCLYEGTQWKLATKKPLCVSLSLCLWPLSLCLTHIHTHTHTGAWAHSFLCLCAHTAVDLALGSTKVKIWYITQWLIDFSTPGELPALSTGVRERDRQSEREKIREQHTLFHKVWLTNWILWLQLELQTSVTSSYTADTWLNRNVCVRTCVCVT